MLQLLILASHRWVDRVLGRKKAQIFGAKTEGSEKKYRLLDMGRVMREMEI